MKAFIYTDGTIEFGDSLPDNALTLYEDVDDYTMRLIHYYAQDMVIESVRDSECHFEKFRHVQAFQRLLNPQIELEM